MRALATRRLPGAGGSSGSALHGPSVPAGATALNRGEYGCRSVVQADACDGRRCDRGIETDVRFAQLAQAMRADFGAFEPSADPMADDTFEQSLRVAVNATRRAQDHVS